MASDAKNFSAQDAYVGIMTGSSLDAADAVLCVDKNGAWQTIAHASVPMPPLLSSTLRQMDDNTPIVEVMETANKVTALCAQAYQLLAESDAGRCANIAAIGCHGQTILHRPACGWTLQLLNGAQLAEQTDVDVVCDFRARDIAAGGQGAPLTPLFHHAVFASHAPCAIINLGGIANITLLYPNKLSDNAVRGWDIGPANMLMDAWMQKHNGELFDRDGAWAASGKSSAAALKQLNTHSFLSLPPPKSCGREEFDLRHFQTVLADLSPQDAQATLLEWSAQHIAAAINNEKITRVFICGGGARNCALMSRIAELSAVSVVATDSVGIPAELVEAAAFAWLARAFMLRTPHPLPAITGAKGNRILGAHYPR